MANTLLNRIPQVFNGLGTLTFTVPSTGTYNVQCQTTVPQSQNTGFGAGTGADQGLGATGGFPGAGQVFQTTSHGQTGLGTSFPNTAATGTASTNPTTMAETTPNLPSVATGSGVTGLGFGGSENDGATGVNGHGAGVGGGTLAEFDKGGGGTGDGDVGQAFGADTSGHPQPLAFVTTPTTVAGLASGLSITVKDNGSTVYTAPTLGQFQSALQFKRDFQFTSGHTVTVVFASSTASDEQLAGITSTLCIGDGQ